MKRDYNVIEEERGGGMMPRSVTPWQRFVRMSQACIVVALCLVSAALRAESPSNRLVLVGVVTGATASRRQDIAVLKDSVTKKSIFVRKGDSLKEFPGYTVVSITAKKVVVSGSGEKVTLVRDNFPSDGKDAAGYSAYSDSGSSEYFPLGDLPPPPPPPSFTDPGSSMPYPGNEGSAGPFAAPHLPPSGFPGGPGGPPSGPSGPPLKPFEGAPSFPPPPSQGGAEMPDDLDDYSSPYNEMFY